MEIDRTKLPLDLKGKCLARLAVPKVDTPQGPKHVIHWYQSGCWNTHMPEKMPHVCMEDLGHGGDHKCGLTTSEVWLQYCHHEWAQKEVLTTA